MPYIYVIENMNLSGCLTCGVVVHDRNLHDTDSHPVAVPFEDEEEVDLDELPEDEDLPEVPEESSEEEMQSQPTPVIVVIGPDAS